MGVCVASGVFVEWLMGVQPEQGPEMGVGTKGLNPDAGIRQEQMERRSVPALGISRKGGVILFQNWWGWDSS